MLSDTYVSLFFVSVFVAFSRPAPLRNGVSWQDQWSKVRLKTAAEYLFKYGYTKQTEFKFPSEEFDRALRKFAQHVGFDGKNRRKLFKMMNRPRCSKSPDEDMTHAKHGRNKRFVANGHKWGFTDITWRFRDPFYLFKQEKDFNIVRLAFARAFDMWSKATGRVLNFNDLSEIGNTTANMDIFFAKFDHGDHEPFDGQGGIVAHSGYPMEGRVHIDASELWTINGNRGIDLRYVILHELGHALGLRHSNRRNAIMHPIYRSSMKKIALSRDDIKGIKYLYSSIIKQPVLR